MHTATMTVMMQDICNVTRRLGFGQCCNIFFSVACKRNPALVRSGQLEYWSIHLNRVELPTQMVGDGHSRSKFLNTTLNTGHDILLARKPDHRRSRCPTKLHPAYLQQQETRLPQHKEKNATCHCAVHSTHTQPEPETA